MILGIMVVECLGVPAAFASTFVTPPPLTAGVPDGPPVPTTGPGSPGLPVSDQYSLRALRAAEGGPLEVE